MISGRHSRGAHTNQTTNSLFCWFSWNIMPRRLEWIKSMCVCVPLIVQLDSEQCSLQKMRLAADCTHADTLKAQLALTGNTSSPRCQSFLLGLGLCPWFSWRHYYFLCWVSFRVLKYAASWNRMIMSSTFNWAKASYHSWHLSIELKCELKLITWN